MLKSMIKMFSLLIVLSILITVVESYKAGRLESNILFRNNPEIAREIEDVIDIMTLKDATNFIKNLPVR